MENMPLSMEMRRLFGGKYPGLKGKTVSDFKLAYLELKKKQDNADDDAKEIEKKTVRLILLPVELMQKVVDLVAALRLKGSPVNDRSLLLENGGHVNLNRLVTPGAMSI